MRKIVLACLAAAVAVAACEKKAEGPLVPADYRGWTRVPAEPLRYPIPGHLDNARVAYINPIGMQAVSETRDGRVFDRYPEGTVIVKEIFSSLQADVTKTPQRLTVMIKASGDKRTRGGWLWVVADPSTGREEIIDWEFCYECHAAANEPHPYGDKNPNGEYRDFAFFPYKLGKTK